jgi:4-diphosphocytidyl-2-C-methyl-D-erythritol kinase
MSGAGAGAHTGPHRAHAHAAHAHAAHAHAKLNLVLHILARESTGFHGIETLFQRLALHDVVTLDVSVGDRALVCDGPAMPANGLGAAEDNLAWRAAEAYTRAAGWDTGWSITIDKHIPVGGGLGGGSADAAAVLQLLERVSPTPLGSAALLELAGTLGADVPFLLSGDARAWAWSRGDRLLPLTPLPPMAVTLVAFDVGVNTGAAYRAFAEARGDGGVPTARRYAADAFANWDAIAGVAANDFEQVVPAMHDGVATVLPQLRNTARVLRDAGHAAMGAMSGSGATCFLLRPLGVAVDLDVPTGARIVYSQTLGQH